MRYVISFLIVLLLVSTINITTSFAQDPISVSVFEHPDGAEITDFGYSPNSATFVTVTHSDTSPYGDGTIYFWDVATGTLRNTSSHPNGFDFFDVDFSPDSTLLASGSVNILRNDDQQVYLWDVATGTLVKTLVGHTDWVLSVDFGPDGRTLASGGGSQDETARLWDVATGTLTDTIDYSLDHAQFGVSVIFSPNGRILATQTYRAINFWDVMNGRHLHNFADGDNNISGHLFHFAFSPDSTKFVNRFTGNSMFDDLGLWDVATGEHLQTFLADNARYPVFSPDGSKLAAYGDGGVHLWDVATGALLNVFSPAFDYCDFSPDGRTLVTAGHANVYKAINVWDVATGEIIHKLMLPEPYDYAVDSVKYSPDGATIAAVQSFYDDQVVFLWRLTPTAAPITFNPNNVADQMFEVGTPVNLTLPSATGGTAPYTYTLSPIPAGLQFDRATQLLSGTPTTATPATSVTYTATDTAGASASLTFTITVTDATPADITFDPRIVDDLTLILNTPMDPLYLPFATGGTEPYTYTLDPIPAGLYFDAAIQVLSGTPTTEDTTVVTYTATDVTGASATLTFTIEVIEEGIGVDPLDVNGDGQITVIDLAIVALFYGTQVPVGVSLPADVNADGVIDLLDLTAVAQAIDAAGGGLNQLSLWEVEAALLAAVEQAAEIEAIAGAPGRAVASVSVRFAAKNVSDALAAARTDVRNPQKGFAVLEKFLALLTELTATPETTALLPNYPNPFNPETWIPYHLSKAAEVIVTIYDMRGVAVRQLVLGHQGVGVYQSRGRAAYWDGRNSSGEPVASGVYFYTLTAGDFTATRKLLIAK